MVAPEGEPIAFELDRDKGFSWIGKCEIDINELAAGQKSSAKKDMAVNYLHTILAENDVASVKIFEEMIWKVCDWSENATYRIAGTHYPEYNLVEFDLKQAVVVQVGESE